MSDRIHRRRGQPQSHPPYGHGSSSSEHVGRNQLKALYRESQQSHHPVHHVDPGPESTVLGSMGVADDEPTRVGQEIEPDEAAFGAVQQRPRASRGSVQPEPRVVVDQKPAPTVHRSKRAKRKRGTFTKVVANHVEAPANTLHLPFISEPDSPLAASFRILRHRLREVDSPEIVAVTSPGRNEGKTTVAINLAMAFAEHGRENVLLVEANLRHPAVGIHLGFTSPSCFGQQMAAHLKAPLEPWQVVSCFFPNLHVLAVDPASVGSWRMTAPGLNVAIDQLSSSDYGHIIIDCPSALDSADVNVIEDLADGLLFTARRGETKAEALKKAQRHLAPANFFGVVMIG